MGTTTTSVNRYFRRERETNIILYYIHDRRRRRHGLGQTLKIKNKKEDEKSGSVCAAAVCGTHVPLTYKLHSSARVG